MIFDSFSIQIFRERPESIEVNFITESCGQGIHEETSAGPFDGNFVCQPVTSDRVDEPQGWVGRLHFQFILKD